MQDAEEPKYSDITFAPSGVLRLEETFNQNTTDAASPPSPEEASRQWLLNQTPNDSGPKRSPASETPEYSSKRGSFFQMSPLWKDVSEHDVESPLIKEPTLSPAGIPPEVVPQLDFQNITEVRTPETDYSEHSPQCQESTGLELDLKSPSSDQDTIRGHPLSAMSQSTQFSERPRSAYDNILFEAKVNGDQEALEDQKSPYQPRSLPILTNEGSELSEQQENPATPAQAQASHIDIRTTYT